MVKVPWAPFARRTSILVVLISSSSSTSISILVDSSRPELKVLVSEREILYSESGTVINTSAALEILSIYLPSGKSISSVQEPSRSSSALSKVPFTMVPLRSCFVNTPV